MAMLPKLATSHGSQTQKRFFSMKIVKKVALYLLMFFGLLGGFLTQTRRGFFSTRDKPKGDLQQLQRLSILRKTCQSHPEVSRDAVDIPMASYHSSEHNFTICVINKSASSTLRHILEKIANTTIQEMPPKNKLEKVQYFRKRYYGTRNKDTSNSLRVVFVRNPMDRLVSMYFQMKNMLQLGQIYGSFEEYILEKRLKHSYEFDPHQFVNYVQETVEQKSPQELDLHAMPQWMICPVCSADFIGHVEMMDEDLTKFYQKIELEDKYTGIHRHQLASKDNSSLHNFLSVLPQREIEFLLNLYKLDFDLFGYEMPKKIP